MIISLGLDHRAAHLRDFIVEHLEALEFEVLDRGASDSTPIDYPDVAKKVAKDIKTMKANFGVLGCRTGIGMSIAANKFQGIRAALVHSEIDARLAREQNDANIMCVAGETITLEILEKMLDIFFMAEFEGGRHERRLSKIVEFEFSQK
ncbi:MAG: ribose 5-phosphate isomerase B [Puniceicoccales bacterium]|jgi:ribose 5-phosphate isomerase B|nr:ribose 5-phosphate isomerase B [Puniceicoccales bacterium]